MAKESRTPRSAAPEAAPRKRSSKCFVYLFATFVTIFAVCLAIASIVLHAESPEVELRSASVKHFTYSNNSTSSSSSASFNGTMIGFLTIKNPNFGDFKYEMTKVSVLYGGMLLGDMKLGSARMKAKETKGMNITVNMRTSRLLVTGNLTSEIDSRMLRLTSYARLSGTVHLFKIMSKRKTTEMACSINLNLTSLSFHNFHCS